MKKTLVLSAAATAALALALGAYLKLHGTEEILAAAAEIDPGKDTCLTCEILTDPADGGDKAQMSLTVCGKREKADWTKDCLALAPAWCEIDPKKPEKEWTGPEKDCADLATLACIEHVNSVLASGARLVPGTCLKSAYDPGVTVDGGGEVPTATTVSALPLTGAACSSGANCEQLVGGKWTTAKRALVMPPGYWRGAGCVAAFSVETEARERVAGCTNPQGAGCSIPSACRP
jgi:hypothetical protein